MEKLIEMLTTEGYNYDLIDGFPGIEIDGYSKKVYVELQDGIYSCWTEKHDDEEMEPYNEKTVKTIKAVKTYIKNHAA